MNRQKHKILIADHNLDLLRKIRNAPVAKQYHFEVAHDGIACLTKIESFLPDLIILDAYLPKIHGIEILRKVKTDPRTKHVGVIFTCFYPLIQFYRPAIALSVDFFLPKPYAISKLFSLCSQFFKGSLHPEPFHLPEELKDGEKSYYISKPRSLSNYLKFWGTRGSHPVSGPQYTHFGGNTTCLEIRNGSEMIIFDAGSGIRPLGNTLRNQMPKEVHLLFSHTHIDHLSGFSFFDPIYDPNCHVHIWAPIGFEKDIKEIFTDMFAYAFFPVKLDEISASLTFRDIQEGVPFQIGSFTITAAYAFHPGSTLCYKIDDGKYKIGYATDNELFFGYHGDPKLITKKSTHYAPYAELVRFFKGVDLLIHEAQYTPTEYRTKVGWGHSSISNTAAFVKHAEVSDWIITHHDPAHDDDALYHKVQLQYDAAEDLQLPCRIRMAFDGLFLPFD